MQALVISAEKFARLTLAGALLWSLSGCYVFEFFNKKDKKSDTGEHAVFTGAVIGQPLGDKAGGPDEALLASVYATPAIEPPAALRPDPDVYIRRLLRQYRDEGATVARQIGAIEPFRLLLGGASQDFSKAPQEEYDATSLLAVFKVAEEVCKGLVAPYPAAHDGWVSILPHPAASINENVAWLAQRFIGLPSSMIDPAVVPALVNIINLEAAAVASEDWARGNPYAIYVPACATLALDAEALYL